ncbi:hypothetical protein V8F20_003023 [Naviculisporaceae sp. PSN 640]
MRPSILFCSVALLIHGIDALPGGGRSPNSPKYQRRARFRRRQHCGPPQGSRPNIDSNKSKPFPAPKAKPPQPVPVLDPAGSLQGGPVSGLNFLPGFDGNTAGVSVLDMTTFSAPTTPCITTVTQTVDVTVLITASRPRLPLRPEPSTPPVPLVTAPRGEYPVELPPPQAPRPNWHPHPHPHPGPQPEFEPLPEPQPLPLPLPLPQPQPQLERLPETIGPCSDDELKTLDFIIVPAPAPAVPAPTPKPELNPWNIQESPAVGDVAEAGAAVETGFVGTIFEKRNIEEKRDVDCDDDVDAKDNSNPGGDKFAGHPGGPKVNPQFLGGHQHVEGPGDRLLTLTKTRTVHHFETKTPTVDHDNGFHLPHPPHGNIPSFELPLPLPPLPPPPAAPPRPIVTPPPRLAQPVHPPLRRPEPHFEPSVEVIQETHLDAHGQFQVEAENRPDIHEHDFPIPEVQIRTTLCADGEYPNPTSLPQSQPVGPGSRPRSHRHIHCGVKNLAFHATSSHGLHSTEQHHGPEGGHGHLARPRKFKSKRDHSSAKDVNDKQFLLDHFVEEAMTVGACYERCLSTQGQPNGCKSYAFYGSPGSPIPLPRCDLFGEEVGRIFSGGRAEDPHPPLDTDSPAVDGQGPFSEHDEVGTDNAFNTWFDLECGSPLDEKWKALGL